MCCAVLCVVGGVSNKSNLNKLVIFLRVPILVGRTHRDREAKLKHPASTGNGVVHPWLRYAFERLR